MIDQPDDGATRVFVYGTLRTGEVHNDLLNGSRYLGAARTAASFDLRDMGGYPALVEGGSIAVLGEIYEVDPGTLWVLDELEDHPSFYRRTPIELDDGSRVQSYLLPPQLARSFPPIACGDWCRRDAARRSGEDG